MIDYTARLNKVRQQMANHNIDLLFLPRSTNLHYLTGLRRSEPNYGNVIHPGEWVTGAWITPNADPIITMPRMVAEKTVLDGYEIRSLPDVQKPVDLTRQVLTDLKVSTSAKIALDNRSWAETILMIQEVLPSASYSLAEPLLMPLRMVKDETEIDIMRRAGEITELAYESVRDKLAHGMTTLDLISEVNYQLQRHGATTNSFATAFYNRGKNAPFAPHNPQETLLVPLEPPVAISFDFGAVYEGYCYDYGRSVYFGDPDAAYRQAYDLVMQSQAVGIKALYTGNTGENADKVARAVIAEAGYGEAFRHRLGHAIGMDVHEIPFLMESDTTPLQEGMCFTVEPSISTKEISARVEDVVVVREHGGEVLTSGYQALHVVG
ncbi:MAG: Xaa-Pro peptidase family protein [Deinococcota bacterium]